MRSRLGSGPLTLPGLGWLVLFFIVPLAIIFVVSLGTRDRFGGVLLDHVSLDNYRDGAVAGVPADGLELVPLRRADRDPVDRDRLSGGVLDQPPRRLRTRRCC